MELFVDGDYRDYSRSQDLALPVHAARGHAALGAHRLKALVTDNLGNRTWTAQSTLTLKDGLPDDDDRL